MKSTRIKVLALLLSLITVFSAFTGCVQSNESNDKDDKDSKKESEEQVKDSEESESEDEESNITSDSEFDDESESEFDSESENEFESESESEFESEFDSESESESASESTSESESESESESASESESESTNDATSSEDGILVFANGAYSANFIKGDLASAFDNNIYNQVRELFSDKVDLKPSLKTDFVAANAEKYNGPAVLIGDTNYAETATVKKSLKDNQAIAKLVGNKYVIVYSSSDAVTKLLTTLKNTLKQKATATEIRIDSSWDITATVATSYSENVNFKDSGLTQKVDITSLGLGTAYNAGQGCKTYIKSDATKTTFTNICSAIERAGATRYTGNTIGTNLFSTYVTQTQIIHVMYFPNKKQVRTAVDVRGTGNNGFTLPGLSTENKYTKVKNSAMIVCDIGNADWPGGMCIIFKLANGHFFIVDAGIGGKISDGRTYVGSSSGWIYATLAKHADNPKNIIVDGWLITHVHSDHAGGLYDMALGYHGKKGGSKHTVMPNGVKNYIKINKIIYNSPDNLPDCNREHWMGEIIKGFNVQNVVKAHPGQVFFFADLKFTVYGAQDIMLEDSGKCGDTNEFSISIRAEFNGRSLLLLGDSDGIPNKQLALIYKETLKSDYLQMAHHGYGDTGDADVNSYCNPTYAIWVVANADLRSNYKINANSSIKSLSIKTHYKPGTGNLVFDKNWNTSTMSREEMVNAIPKCDGTYCGNSSCSTKTSFKNTYT